MDPIIQINHISKKYKIGKPPLYFTLRESVGELLNIPLKIFQHKGAHITLTKNEFWALNDISFSVNKGEAVGIIGSNGAGKSTLLKILSRITPPTKGEAVLRGRVGSLLEVGTGFHQELTGRENIYLNGSILGMKRSEIDRKFDVIVKFSEMKKFLDMPVKRYSSGMYMRLAFSVAAHLDSEIMIVDEVLAVGDVAFQKKCINKMQSMIQDENRTVLFVSHNMDSISKLCKRSLLLHKGKIEYNGNTDTAIKIYQKNLRTHLHQT